jgi:4-amino-4-deoxy-L-arabinose transferase-like glycosyltransferase
MGAHAVARFRLVDDKMASVNRDRWLYIALIVGLLIRLPGVAWGVNWPDGFGLHHPDEYTHVQNADAIITPFGPQIGVPYPKAMAAAAAVPFLLWYAAHGHFGGPRVHQPFTVITGRLIAVVYGVATIVIVFLIGRDALHDRRAGVLGAWFLALGGLHVTQSHFFLADTPATFWTLFAAWLLWTDLTSREGAKLDHLGWGAFATGAAFAYKLFVFAVPALGYVSLRRPPRVRRAVHAFIFATAGVTVASLGYDTPASFYRAATVGVNFPFHFSRVRAAELFAVQSPAILSFPFLIAASIGTVMLLRRLAGTRPDRRVDALGTFASIPLVAIMFILFKLDPWARHWVVLIPWAAIAAGYALARGIEKLRSRGLHPAILIAPIFVWMLAFVVDAERYFVFEPRNEALRWLRMNVPAGASVDWVGRRTPQGFTSVRWLVEGTPDVLVFEMYEANNSLSGVNWRDSYPSDPAEVFDGRSRERVAGIQGLFRGTSDYVVTATFGPRYVMPEYRVEAGLLGDRSRNYISEIVVFERRSR